MTRRCRSTRWALAACVVAGVWLFAAAGAAGSGAPAAGADFEPTSRAWNGLSYLVETAKEAQVTVEVGASLDWSTVTGDDVLLLVAPRVPPRLAGAEVRRFVRAGGRLIVADDFGAGGAWLRSFGIELLSQPGEAHAYAAGLRYLPELEGGAALGEFLGYHVPRVVLNHPAALGVGRGSGWQHRTLGRFASGTRAWAMEAIHPREQGKVLAISDPSILINTMSKRFYGNKQLAANLLRYGCFEGEPCKVRLLANLSAVRGTFAAAPARRGPRPNLRRRLRAAFDTLNVWLGRPALRPLWWLIVVVLLILPMILAARFGPPQLPELPAGRPTHGRLRRTVRAWLGQPDADYRRPTRQLAQHLARLVTDAEAEVLQRSARRRPATVVEPSPLPEMIRALVARGNLPVGAGRRILGLAATLEDVMERNGAVVSRDRFTQLASEVDWAEQVLRHTLWTAPATHRSSPSAAKPGALHDRRRHPSA